MGLFFSPLGAMTGGVYGASVAVPATEVEQAEALLVTATSEIKKKGLRGRFLRKLAEKIVDDLFRVYPIQWNH